MIRPRNGSLLPNMWPKIEDLLLKLKMKLDHYSRAKFYRKSNGDSPHVARKRCVLTQLKWFYGEKGFLSAVTIQKPEINFFNQFTRRPNLHGNISVRFYKVISNIFKNMSFLAHSVQGALRIVIHAVRSKDCIRSKLHT